MGSASKPMRGTLLLASAAACGMRCAVSGSAGRVQVAGARLPEMGRARVCVWVDDVLLGGGGGGGGGMEGAIYGGPP